jgi:DNA-binding LacI/PurR family transcriptional regulator
MEEFAAVSGLSRPTVSKFFHDPDSVRPSTRRRIEEALERFEYRPNIYAVNQNRRLTKTIGIVVPYLADPFFAEIARNIEARCIDAGFSPSLFSSHGRQDQENDILDTLRSMKPAGVLLAPLGRRSDKRHVERFCVDVPTVLFDANIDGVDAAFIGSDNFQSVPMIVDYLCRTGEPPCFFEMRNPTNPNANKRRNAYVAAMERLGSAPHIVRAEGDSWRFEDIGYEEGRRAFAERLFATNTILCSNDRLAIGLIAAAYEGGIKVGHDGASDVRIAGHDDHPFSRFTCPSLTTVAQDYDAIAAHSLETLLSLIGSDDAADARGERLFEGRLVMRASA